MVQTQKKTRGPARFAGLTYPQIAEWSGHTLHTIRTYSQDGVFDPHDLAATLKWINSRRARRGWQLIGIPDEKGIKIVS